MKTLDDYMAMSYRMEIVEDGDEGGFVVSYPDLPGCVTYGETVENAVANALDAKKAWIEIALEEGIEINEPDRLDNYSGQFKLRMPRSLHRLLAEHSKREGTSMNQYCVYLLSRNDAVYSNWNLQYDIGKNNEILIFCNQKLMDQNRLYCISK